LDRPPKRRVRLKRISERRKGLGIVVAGDLGAPAVQRSALPEADAPGAGQLGEHWLAVAEQHEEVGAAVIVDIDDRTRVFVGCGIEFFDKIDLTVEISVRFATEDRTARVVEFLDV
jgi:hypothetical protein